MKYEIIIIVDTNDMDCETSVNIISKKDLDKIRPLIKAIKNFKPYTVEKDRCKFDFFGNYPYGEMCRTNLGEKSPEELYPFGKEIHELFLEYVPMGNEYGFHTIERIEVGPLIKKERLL